MDWIQFPFEVDAWLLVGAGAPLVRLRWVFTDQRFKPPGTPTYITNRIWDEDQVSDLALGQIQPVAANYEQDARWHLPAGLRPGHTCHPEWMTTGEPYPNDLPPNVYGPDWIPECCGLFQRPATIPVSIGLTTTVHYYPPRPVAVPVSIGLTTTVHYYPPVSVALPVSIGLTVGVEYRPPVEVDIPVSVGLEVVATYTAPSGSWIRDVCGTYVFTAAYSGDHLLKLYGGGGAGHTQTGGGGMGVGGGGGGGGGQSNSVLTLVAGTEYAVTVGCGGEGDGEDGTETSFAVGLVVVVLAQGGSASIGTPGGAGATTVGALGDQQWPGGDGADGIALDFGGGGGSSACYSPTGMPPGDGTDAGAQAGGSAPLPDGGDGGDGGDPLAGGVVGGAPGGGGGGAGAGADDPGGNGRDGRIEIIWPA